MVTPDMTRIADTLNAFWTDHGYTVIIGGGLLALAVITAGLVKAIRSGQRDRFVAIFAAVVVLAWTSEGLWEVARYTIGLPVAFAVATFFVFESMMFRSATQAERHRRRYGTPGPAGRYVWVLAFLTATIVALNAHTLIEALLRFVLPLAGAGLWWVDITAERDSDYEPDPRGGPTVAERRAARAAEREATWAITPSTVLVRLGIKRPGRQDATAAERDYRRRRMVVFADRLHNARPGGVLAVWSAYRLRKLARQASTDDVTMVCDQVARAARIVALVSPEQPDDPPTDHADRRETPAPPVNRPPKATRKGSRNGSRKASTADRVARMLARSPDLTKAQVAAKLGVSERTVQRVWSANPNGSEPTEQ